MRDPSPGAPEPECGCSRCPARRSGWRVGAVNAIAIVDQVAGVLAPGRGLDHLARDPSCGRMGGDVEVEQAAAVVADQEDDVEGSEGKGLDHEQISSPDGFSVVGEEGAPALAARPSRSAAAVASDGACAHGEAELEQLADALGDQVRILARHGGDQRPDLGFKHGRVLVSPYCVITPAAYATVRSGVLLHTFSCTSLVRASMARVSSVFCWSNVLMSSVFFSVCIAISEAMESARFAAINRAAA